MVEMCDGGVLDNADASVEGLRGIIDYHIEV